MLINGPQLTFSPILAKTIGANGAILLELLHKELLQSPIVHDGHHWFVHTYEKWQKRLPYLSRNTIIRTFLKLEKDGYIISQLMQNQRKWYRINYEKISHLVVDGDLLRHGRTIQNGHNGIPNWDAGTQNEKMGITNWADAPSQNGYSNGNADAQSEKTSNSNRANEHSKNVANWVDGHHQIPADSTVQIELQQPNLIRQYNLIIKVINYLNKQANKNYNPLLRIHHDDISKRIEEGYTFEDFQGIIDLKVSQWLHNEKMNVYLRPSTLFKSPNFEKYLREAKKQKPASIYKPIELDFTAGEDAPKPKWLQH